MEAISAAKDTTASLDKSAECIDKGAEVYVKA
jgi:hypothetical protein